ncbi:hypothetical protein HMPREF0291_10826 [Corynebacterium genitalium ATCC 33030]|uniref:Uncharacterized protein n=1 Tax=Corynebacterium genitalium ATCC 33030 TaxID=585529 RepID=D7W9V1_9CORY|nr:hypothetical protein HMPREF0291_10826 [Corynebacterium genitalium ATCC 33030]
MDEKGAGETLAGGLGVVDRMLKTVPRDADAAAGASIDKLVH